MACNRRATPPVISGASPATGVKPVGAIALEIVAGLAHAFDDRLATLVQVSCTQRSGRQGMTLGNRVAVEEAGRKKEGNPITGFTQKKEYRSLNSFKRTTTL